MLAIPAPDQPEAALPPPPEVTISIGDGKDEVSAGQMIRYEVTVHNSGTIETPLTVKLTMPPNVVTGLEAADAAVIANAVAWKHVVGAGQTRTYSLSGRVDHAARSRSLAVTACVHDRLDAPAVACATDRNTLALQSSSDTGARRIAWIGAVVFGILAAIGAVWLYRRIRPEPLKPVSADKPTLPGGAPSD